MIVSEIENVGSSGFSGLPDAKNTYFMAQKGRNGSWRVILVKNCGVLEDGGNKNWILAKGNNQDEIMKDYHDLMNIHSIMEGITKTETGQVKITRGQLEDLLRGLRDRQVKSYPDVKHKQGSNEDAADKLLQHVLSNNNSSGRDTTINSIEDLENVIINYGKSYQCIQNEFKRLQKQPLKARRKILNEVKFIEACQKSINEFYDSFRKKRNPGVDGITKQQSLKVDRMMNQFKQYNNVTKTLLDKPEIKSIREDGIFKKKRQSYRRSIDAKPRKPNEKPTYKNIDNTSDDDSLQVQKHKLKQREVFISQEQLRTIDVETAIAREERDALLQIEQDFTELHDMFSSVKELVAEDSSRLETIAYNVQKSNDHINRGTKDIKRSKKIARFGLG